MFDGELGKGLMNGVDVVQLVGLNYSVEFVKVVG